MADYNCMVHYAILLIQAWNGYYLGGQLSKTLRGKAMMLDLGLIPYSGQ